jgi:hypothetical protein
MISRRSSLINISRWFDANWSETGAGRIRTRNGVNDPLQVQVAVREGLGLSPPIWRSYLPSVEGKRSLLADP